MLSWNLLRINFRSSIDATTRELVFCLLVLIVHFLKTSKKYVISKEMTKVKKLKKKKRYQYNINRKRMNKKKHIVTDSGIAIKNSSIAEAISRKSLKKLGFVNDVNQDIKLMNKMNDTRPESSQINETSTTSTVKDFDKNVKSSLKGKSFRFSKDQVDFLSYLLNKYGDDFKAMSRDRKNYLQHTWKQIRYKINLFKSIPDHYNEFLKNKEVS